MIKLWQRLRFVIREAFTPKKLDAAAKLGAEAVEKAQLGLELRYLDGPEAEITEKISRGAAELIKSLDNIDSAVLRMGSLLVIKCNFGGRCQIVAESISPQLRKLLESNPRLLSDPHELLDAVRGIKDASDDRSY